MGFDTFRQRHDPNGRADWTFQFRLNSGESLASAEVAVVDPTSTTVDGATDLVIETTALGQISGSLWGVTVWISGGHAGTDYYLRCHVETDAAPISRKGDRTMILACEEQ